MCTDRTWRNSILRPWEKQNIILKYVQNQMNCNVQVCIKIGEKGGPKEVGDLFVQGERQR